MYPFQKKIPRGKLYHSVAESIRYLIKCTFDDLNNTSEIERFEKIFAEYCGKRYTIAFPKARVALWFYLKGLDLPKGSKILMPPITIKGMLDVVLDLDLEPIYSDIDTKTAFPVLNNLKDIVTEKKPKACLLTPLFGITPDMHPVISFLKNNNVKVIVDFSQCLNCYISKHSISSLGDISIYSSSSIKTLDTLGGGLALTNSEPLYLRLKKQQQSLKNPQRPLLFKKGLINLLRNILTSRIVFSIFTFWIIQFLSIGFPQYMLRQTGTRNKSRIKGGLPREWFEKFSSVQAEIGLEQLPKISEQDFRRIQNARQIINSTDRDNFLRTPTGSISVYWQLLYLVESPINAKLFFAKKNIDVAATSLSLISSLKDYPNSTRLKNAEKIYLQSIFIPCFSTLSRKEIAFLVQSVSTYNSLKKQCARR